MLWCVLICTFTIIFNMKGNDNNDDTPYSSKFLWSEILLFMPFCLESKFTYPIIINSRKPQNF